MDAFLELIRWADAVAFAALAIVTGRQWAVRRDEASLWMFLTFGSLGAIVALGRVLPDDSDWVVIQILDRILIAVLLLFPYFLYRVAATFTKGSVVMDRIALVLTAIMVAWTAILPEFPESGEPRPLAFQVYVLAVLFDWVLLSSVVAIRFWRGGSGQPPVARRRMRALSVASIALSIALVIAGASPGDRAVIVDIGIQVIVLASVFFFFFAFAPPRWLRAAWRRQSEEALRRAVIDLMGAVTDEAVIQGLLPHAAGIIGGEGVALLDKDGAILASYGVGEGQWEVLARGGNGGFRQRDRAATKLTQDLTKLDFPFGSMVVKTNPYTPFFGRDEIDLLGSLGVMANLALDRVRASEMRLELAEAQLRRQQALEIHDNVVQGLAVAKYAMDLGETEKVKEAIEGTLAAARTIISDLLEEIGDDDIFGPNALIRDRAATGFTRKDP